MGQRIKSLESASSLMVEAAIPLGMTPARAERIASFEEAEAQLAKLQGEIKREVARGRVPHYATFVPLGIYATRKALLPLVLKDEVDFGIAGDVAGDLQDYCAFLSGCIDFGVAQSREVVGFLAEVGVPNMVWTGIAEGQLGLSEAVLMGAYGRSERNVGLPDDVDLMVRPKWYKDNDRKKVQLKSSSEDAGNIYGIPVVAAQDLAGASTPSAAVKKLLNWSTVGPTQREETYRIFEESLGLVRRNPGPVVAKIAPPVRPIAA